MKQSFFYITIITMVFAALLIGVVWGKEEFFPHSDGLSWTYGNGETQTLSGPHEVDGANVMILAHIVEGELVSEDYLIYSEAGVQSLGTSTVGGDLLQYDPPLLIYQGARLSVGQAWQSDTELLGLEISLQSEVTGIQGIETPVGKFNALVIRQSTITNTGGRTTLYLYFVPAIGVVRFVQSDGTVVNLVDKNF